jgi:hypothetical protein
MKYFIEKQTKKGYICLIIFSLSLISFFLGFFLRENLAGGGALDLIHEWHNYNLLKNNILAFISENYEASRFPFFHMLNILLNKFIENNKDFINSFFIYSLLLPIIFFFSLKTIFKKNSNHHLLLLVSILFLSPYFRTSSFWGLQENLAYIFFLLSLFIDEKFKKKIKLKIFISFLSFYSDQKFIFLPFAIILKNILNKNIQNILNITNIKLILFFLLCFLPALFIFSLWGGLTPKITTSGVNKESFNPQNIIYFTNIISIYLLPFLFFKLKKIFSNININLKFFLLAITTLVSIYLVLRFFFMTELLYGGGWAYKIYQLISFHYNILGELIFFLIFILSSLIVIIYFINIDKNFLNIFILFYLYLQSIILGVVFQEYFDPLMLFLIIFFFEKKNLINYKFYNFIILFTYFMTFTICVSIYRYLIL